MGSSGVVESGSGQARGRSSRARGPGPRGHDDSPWGSGPGRDGGGRPKARPFRLDPSDVRGVQDRARSASKGALDIAEARVTGVRTEPRGAGTCTDAMARCRSPGVRSAGVILIVRSSHCGPLSPQPAPSARSRRLRTPANLPHFLSVPLIDKPKAFRVRTRCASIVQKFWQGQIARRA